MRVSFAGHTKRRHLKKSGLMQRGAFNKRTAREPVDRIRRFAAQQQAMFEAQLHDVDFAGTRHRPSLLGQSN